MSLGTTDGTRRCRATLPPTARCSPSEGGWSSRSPISSPPRWAQRVEVAEAAVLEFPLPARATGIGREQAPFDARHDGRDTLLEPFPRILVDPDRLSGNEAKSPPLVANQYAALTSVSAPSLPRAAREYTASCSRCPLSIGSDSSPSYGLLLPVL